MIHDCDAFLLCYMLMASCTVHGIKTPHMSHDPTQIKISSYKTVIEHGFGLLIRSIEFGLHEIHVELCKSAAQVFFVNSYGHFSRAKNYLTKEGLLLFCYCIRIKLFLGNCFLFI